VGIFWGDYTRKFFIEILGEFSVFFAEFVGAIWLCSYDSSVDFVGGVNIRT
jgi:hypothetical protein